MYADNHKRFRVVDEDDTILASFDRQIDAEVYLSRYDDTYLMDAEMPRPIPATPGRSHGRLRQASSTSSRR